MKSTLDYVNGHLCILNESEPGASSLGGPPGSIREWYAVREAAEAEVATLVGRPVTRVESEEGLYVDEDGNPYQLAQFGRGEPLAVKITPLRRGPDEPRSRSAEGSDTRASAPGTAAVNFSASRSSADSVRVRPKALLRKPRRKRQAAAREKRNGLPGSVAMLAELPTESADDQPPREKQPEENPQLPPAPLNLRQKLAEVRHRIGYIQKRGRNERHSYSYVTAADIAGAVGDILAELGVIVVPRLESISHEPARSGRTDGEHLTHVVMSYSFVDVNTAEEITVKVAGEGVDAGDKAPYKAMTGALKYALLQSFLLATGDDPEEERVSPGNHSAPPREPNYERTITPEAARELRQLVEDTGTDLERVLAYYKLSSLEEMTEGAYRRAVELLNRKKVKRTHTETTHAQD